VIAARRPTPILWWAFNLIRSSGKWMLPPVFFAIFHGEFLGGIINFPQVADASRISCFVKVEGNKKGPRLLPRAFGTNPVLITATRGVE
jgi:hypothetical protein